MNIIRNTAARPAREPGYVAVRVGHVPFLLSHRNAYQLADQIADAIEASNADAIEQETP